MRRSSGTWKQLWQLGAALALAGGSIACGGANGNSTQVILQLAPGSNSVLSAAPGAEPLLPGLPTSFTTDLQGSIVSTVNLNLNIGEVLRSGMAQGTLTTNEILIAGNDIMIAPGLETGVVCTRLDPSQPTTGTFQVDLRAGTVKITAMATTVIQTTDPAFSSLFPPISNPVKLDITAPANLGDLLGVLQGRPLPLEVTQMSVIPIPDGVPGLMGGSLALNLNLVSAGERPMSATLDQCNAFFAMNPLTPPVGPMAPPMAPTGPAAPPDPMAPAQPPAAPTGPVFTM